MLSVLVTVAAPRDAAPLDAESAFHELAQTLEPLCQQQLVAISRCAPATERDLKRCLGEQTHEVLHYIGHGRAGQAHYASLLFESSDKAARGLSAQYLAGVLQKTSLRVVVLQAAAESSLSECAGIIAGAAIAVLAVPRLDSRLAAIFYRAFYSMLASGSAADEALAAGREALAARGGDTPAFALFGQGTPVVPIATSAQPSVKPPPRVPPASVPPAVKTATPEDPAKAAIERKRAAGQFDVFLCYNWVDRAAVKQIAKTLRSQGVLPWLDEWELQPGQPWQPLLERQIGVIKSAAVFVGKAGIGPWQEQELNGFLREFVARKSPVIPVLLLDAPEKPELPIFLRAMTWVDFRLSDPDPLERLIWGITGNRTSE